MSHLSHDKLTYIKIALSNDVLITDYTKLINHYICLVS